MRAPANYLRVDLADAAEAEYWLVVLDTNSERLAAAVSMVGHDALEVHAWLTASR
ncbi:MAG: DUF3606 domain-containing protein [Arenimonas sp.]